MQAAPQKRSFYRIESTASFLHARGIRIDKQEGQKAWASVTSLQLSSLRQQATNLVVREYAELPLPKSFKNLGEIEQEMADLATKYPKHVQLVNLSQRFKTPNTADGRSLLALRIHAPNPTRAPAPTVLMDSTHHARELITPLIMLDAAKRLAKGYGKDKKITAWIKHYEIWIVPLVNPDGYHHVFTQDPFWRKNRRANEDGTFGVDLNRNYPFLWGTCGKNSSRGSSEIYKGRRAASEPEIQTMIALGEAIQPQLYLTYHSYGNEIIRPYVCATATEEKLLSTVTHRLAQAAGYKFRKASSSGESFEHFYALYGSLSYLVEVGRKFHPDPLQIPGLLQQASKTWQVFLQRGMEAAVIGVVRGMNHQEPIRATLSIDGIVFQAGERRHSRKDTGFYAWTLLPGTYTLRAQAPGYLSWSQKITVPPDRFIRINIEMQQGTDAIDAPLSVDANTVDETSGDVVSTVSERSTPEPGASSTEEKHSELPKDKSSETSRTEPVPPHVQGCSCQSQTRGPLLWLGLLLLSLLRKRTTSLPLERE